MSAQFKVIWLDSGREPKCQPNPEFPKGIHIKYDGAAKHCTAELPYPAPRCGVHVVQCLLCGFKAGITAAGRADDPRSVDLICKNQPTEAPHGQRH